MRLIAAGAPAPPPRQANYVKNVLGGLLVQDYDTLGWDAPTLKIVTKRQPTPAELKDLAFAWLVGKHLKSNAICLVKNRELVGAGAGQMEPGQQLMDRRPARRRARRRARPPAATRSSPSPTASRPAAKAGVTAIVQPGGSKGDPETIAAADKHGIAMVFTGVRHFRH